MKFTRHLLIIITIIIFSLNAYSQSTIESLLPIRGLSISIPSSAVLDSFITFIHKELVPRKVNTLIIMVGYNYQYKSHPELAEENSLSVTEVKKIVNACRQNNIRIIPQINLLGHQSWASKTGMLLQKYPQFDETPHVQMPEKYVWPNADGLYCKSYCPLHPDVHKIVFDLIDEICEVFETNAFHAGMDEVFYISDDKCPRCSGKDKAELFAGEVRTIHDHLAMNKKELWIWGDRLLDGKTTGLGMWEASFNNTHRAIDMIPKDVVICDWHYERPDKTPVYFAMKGFNVIACPWNKPAVGVEQVNHMVTFRKHSTRQMRARLLGVMETVWSSPQSFLRDFYKTPVINPVINPTELNTAANCFKAVYEAIGNLVLVK
ncbi:MAG TPA: family 20 glycosylhydrolase [Chitinophagaceae bacterium]|nr:family 20 glycosylhydrolase [Chitinophagaceae bacterium]